MRSRTGTFSRAATLFAGLAGILVAGALLHPQFLTVANQRNVLSQVSINGILAVGMTLVILTAGIDLSVGSVLSLCTVVCAMLLMQRPGVESQEFTRAHVLVFVAAAVFAALGGYALGKRIMRNRHPRAAIATGVAIALLAAAIVTMPALYMRAGGYGTLAVLLVVPPVGALMGLANGVIIATTRLQPFIVTLAMMISAVGLAKYVAGEGGRIHPVYTAFDDKPGAPQSFESLGGTFLTVGQKTLRSGRVRDVKLLPVPGLFFAGAWLLAAFLLLKLPVGRYVYAVGGNEETSRLSGLPVAGVKIFVYTACGLLAGLAAVLYCSQYMQGKADAGQMKELDAIAAVVIGGTSLMGGRGSIAGTLVGVMIFGYLSNILQLRAVSSEIQDILKGVIIVVAAGSQSAHVHAGVRLLFGRRRVGGDEPGADTNDGSKS